MVAFIAEANWSGVILTRNSWSMLLSRASAWAGLSAWSQDCWKLGAFFTMSNVICRNVASPELASFVSAAETTGTPPLATKASMTASVHRPSVK